MCAGWTHDLHKSHYHNLLKTASEPGKEINVNVLVLTAPGAGAAASDGKKDAALYAMTYGSAYVAAVSHRLDNTQLVATLRAASEFVGPAVITAPATADMLSAMTNDDESPMHYTWDPTRSPGSRLEVAADCHDKIIDEKFLAGEENISMLLKQLEEPAEPSEEKLLESAMADRIADVNRVDENKVITVFYGSESPGKNGKFVADDICQKIKQNGFYVDTGGPISLDSVMAHDRLTAPAEEDGPRKKAIAIISTAGVGEFPDGSKGFAKEAFGARIEKDYESHGVQLDQSGLNLSNVDFAVFGLGDTNYHPAEKHLVDSFGSPWTFCTPAKIVHKVFETCGAKPLCEVDFGDDSEMGGFNAGYERWSDALWGALAKSGGEAPAATASAADEGPKLDPNEYIKVASDALKQPLLNDLMDPTNEINIQGDSAQISKHHGIYQQKLRDHDIITDEQKANPFSFMVRVRLPGGDCTPAQMKGMLDICDTLGNSTVKITTRQTFQLHGIQKKGLIESINQINKYAMDTIAACGDVNRNVMATCVKYPTMDPRDPNLARYERTVMQCNEAAKEISIHLLPDGLCNTYHEIWVNRGRPNHTDEAYKKKNKVYVKGNALKYRPDGTLDLSHEPVLKERYLPRKFKIAISIPPFNDTDCFAHCIGFIAISDASGELLGFNVSIGGGLGATRHGLTKAYPRLGDIIGYCNRADANWVAQKILEIQRDHGCRTDRTHARLKYTVEDLGADFFLSEINRRMSEDEDCRHLYPRGFRMQAALPFEFKDNKDTFGESVNTDGTHNFALYMQNGRIKNYDEGFYSCSDGDGALAVKDAVYEISELGTRHTGRSPGSRPPFHWLLTNNQNLVVSHVPSSMRHEVLSILEKHRIPVQHTDDVSTYSSLMKNAMACVALPTCGLAMAPAETYLPELLYKMEKVMDELEFTQPMKDIIVRMSGCPNGCSRMVLGEICFVGRSMEVDPDGKPLGIYDMSFGGNEQGSRLATMYKKGLNEQQILDELRPIFKEYKRYKEMRPAARFGDFAIEHGLTRECKARPTMGKAGPPGSGLREPGITYHLSVTYKDEMVEEVAQLAEANVDKLGDVLKNRYGVTDVRSVQW